MTRARNKVRSMPTKMKEKKNFKKRKRKEKRTYKSSETRLKNPILGTLKETRRYSNF